MTKKLLLAAAALSAGGQADAAAVIRGIEVRNAGFEESVLEDGQYVGDAVEGWKTRGALAAYTGTANLTVEQLPVTPEGRNVAFVNSFDRGNGRVSGGFYQDTAEAITAGQLYTLNVDVARRLDAGPSGTPIQLGRFEVQLSSGLEVLASGSFTDAQLAPGTSRNLQLQYTATGAYTGPLRISFYSFYDDAQNGEIRQALFDNVMLTAQDAAVPEPATWAMLIGGFGAVGAASRRRRTAVRFA